MHRKNPATRRQRNITSVEWTDEYADVFAMLLAMSEDPLDPQPLAECLRQVARLGFLAREHIYAKDTEDARRKIDRQERFTSLKYTIQNNMMLRSMANLSDEEQEAINHDSELYAAKFLRAGDALELAAVELKEERLRSVGLVPEEAQ